MTEPVAEPAGPGSWWVRRGSVILARFYGSKAEIWAKLFARDVKLPEWE